MITGHIPEKITFIYSASKDVGVDWEDGIEAGKKVTVFPAYPCDTANPKNLESGRVWAEDGCFSYSWEGGKRIETEVAKIQEEVFDNKFTNIQVVSIEYRRQGGRAYKVIVNGKYWVDFRDDVLLDVLIEAGVKKGGVLNGEYVFARVGSQMKLVRIGSELYKKLTENTKRRKLGKISNDDLKPGRVYLTKSGDEILFLGWISTVEFKTKKEKYNQNWYNGTKEVFDKAIRVKKALLMWEGKPEDFLNQLGEKVNDFHYFYLKIVKNHSFVETSDKHIKIPTNVLEKVKQSLIVSRQNCKEDSWVLYYSNLLNMIEYGKEPVIDPRFEHYIK